MTLANQALEAINPIFVGKDANLINDTLCLLMSNVVVSVAVEGNEMALCEENFQNVRNLIQARLDDEKAKKAKLDGGIEAFSRLAQELN